MDVIGQKADVSSRWRKFSKVLVLSCLVVVALDAYPLVGLRSRDDLKASIVDEWHFIRFIAKCQDALLQGDVTAPFTTGNPCGYGSFYWTSSAIISLPLRIAGWPTTIIGLRLLSLFFKALTLAFIVESVGRVRTEQRWIGWVLVALMLSMPAFAFFGKVISCEYLLMAMTTAAYWQLLLDSGRWGRSFWISLFLIGLAVVTKPNIFWLLFPWVIAWPYCLVAVGIKNALVHTLIVVAATVLLGLHGLCSAEAMDFMLLGMRANTSGLHWFNLQHLHQWYVFDSLSWEGLPFRGLRSGFISFTLIIALGIVTAVGWKASAQKTILSAALFGPILCITLIMGTQVHHTWYIFPAVAALLVAVGHSLAALPQSSARHALACVTIILIGNLSMQATRIQDHYARRIKLNRLVEENRAVAGPLLEVLRNAPKGSRVLCDHFLPIDQLSKERRDLNWKPCMQIMWDGNAGKAHALCDYIITYQDETYAASPLQTVTSIGQFWSQPAFDVAGRKWRFETLAKVNKWQVLVRHPVDEYAVRADFH